ncbi:two-component regulator propeller domain-containing protein [uncultured Cytophaga sp.]|uniref:type IX secretion system anionic LPS delivery protein PorZ n=1 Tax=uncultured Cytophaga sp. TaxID=160238 RepID=UPI00261ED125|nr:two-component regulator propeller domain-containing protein [uncultured Cytophaga sp.]
MRFLACLFLVLQSFWVVAQTNSNVQLGVWRTHLPTNSAATVSILNNKIYAATTKSCITVDISDNYIAPLSKVDGLTQSDIEVIRFDEATQTGLIGYSNGNIDILKNGALYNFDVIFRSNVAGSKKINNIIIYKNTAFISTDYGVSVLNLKKNEVIESWQSLRPGGLPNIVYAATLNAHQDSVFLATEYGLMSAPYGKPGINLMDFTNWKVYTDISTTDVQSVGEVNGRVYAGLNKTGVFVLAGNTWQNIGLSIDTTCWNFVKHQNQLLVCAQTKLYSIKTPSQYDAIPLPTGIKNIHDATIDQSGKIWVADTKNGLTQLNGADYKEIYLNGPLTTNTFNLYYYKNNILANSGGYTNSFSRSYIADGIYEFQNQDSWTNYNRYNSNFPEGFSDNIIASYNSFDDTLYIGSYGNGMLGFKKPNTFVKTDANNSPLKSNYVTGLDTDANGTLWIATRLTPQYQPGLFAKTKSGIWSAYTMNASRSENRNILQLKIDSLGNKWMRYGNNGMDLGLMVYNEKTYQERYFSTGSNGGNLPSNNINCLDIDNKGVVWIGSDQGISAFYDPSLAFSSSFVAPIYNGFGVLFDKSITCIKTDGGNRKWVGTTDGLWLFNDNFTEPILFFTTENSPLSSNNIISIEIHDLTGEVFIATENGIISYRSNATASNEDFKSAKIFPNPVRPGYSGLLTIEGLKDNVMVKVTDMQGKLFYEVRSNGGTATWNLKNYAGVKAETGMYLVFATTEKGEEKFVGKIAIVE